jgi:hypothetical protein
MNSSFTVELFDLLVYLVPGAMALGGAYLLLSEQADKWISKLRSKGLTLTFSLIGAFFLGVVIHIIAGFGYSAIHKITDYDLVGSVTKDFHQRPLIDEILKEKYKVIPINDDEVYRYAEAVVFEKSVSQARNISRLMALAICCRNAMVSLVILTVAFIIRFRPKFRSHTLALTAFLIVIEFLMFRGSVIYWAAAVQRVFRILIASHGL